MQEEEINKILNDMLTKTRDFLKHAIKKSGIYGDLEGLKTMITFRMNDDRVRSMFLGEYVTPTEKHPNGEIIIHIDSIVDYSEFLGVDYWSLITKITMCQIHHVLTWNSKQKFNFIKAEKFGTKICRKLAQQNIINDVRPKMYIPLNDNSTIIARQKWIEKWVGTTVTKTLDLMTPVEEFPTDTTPT